MRQQEKSSKQHMLIKLLVPYLLILLVPLGVGLIIYDKTVGVIEEEAIQNNLRILEMTKETVDMRLTEAQAMVRQIASRPEVLAFQQVQDAFADANPIRMIEIRKSLFEFPMVNQFILNYYLIYHKSGVVMTANAIYKTAEFYEHYFSYAGMDQSTWHNEFTGSYVKHFIPQREVKMNGKAYSAISYIERLGSINTDNSMTPAAVMVLIDNEEVHKLLGQLQIAEDGWASITDQEGREITRIGSPASPGEMMLSRTTSAMNGWTYTAAQPTHIVLQKVNYIERMSLFILIITLVLGGGVAAVSAYRNSKPFNRLLDMNEALSEKVREQMPLLRFAFYERVLNGEFHTQQDLHIMMNHTGSSLGGGRYAILIVQFGGMNEEISKGDLDHLDIKRVIIKQTLHEAISGQGFVHDVGTDQFILLVNCGFGDEHASRNHVNLIIRSSVDKLAQSGISVTIAVGGIVESLMEVPGSFGEARWALNSRKEQYADEVIWYDEMSKDRFGFYYANETESRLINLIQAGDRSGTELVLQELYRHNFEDRHLSVHMVRLLLYAMIGSMVKLHSMLPLDERVNEHDLESLIDCTLDNREDYMAVFGQLRTAFVEMSKEVHLRKENRSGQLINQIMDVIDEHYLSADMSLDYLADRFNLSTKYLSELFKEQTGINFSDYLIKVRMEKAKELLMHTQLAVYDITVRVGYNSANSFCRAFKRIHGISPAAFRSLGVEPLIHMD